MNHFKLGVACVIDKNQNLKGVFTDGDFRRLLLKSQRPLSRIFIEDIIDIVGENFISNSERGFFGINGTFRIR